MLLLLLLKIKYLILVIQSKEYNTKINDIEKKITDRDHDKYIFSPEFNKLTPEKFAARLS